MKGNGGGTAITVDQQGFIYATGKIESPYTTYDFWTAKYNASGVKIWEARYDGPANGVDIANAIAVDGGGNVYVTGVSTGVGTRSDFATVKYNSVGQELWVARYNGPGNAGDAASAIAVDNEGNAFVCGESTTSIYDTSWNYDCTTIKYNSLGVEQWVNRYDGPEHRDDEAIAIKLDPSGNVYVAGRSLGPQSYYYPSGSAIVIKYSSSGSEDWVTRYRVSDSLFSNPVDISFDDSCNSVVTGYVLHTPGLPWDIRAYSFVARINSEGTLQWTSIYQDPGDPSIWGSRAISDVDGNTFALLMKGTSFYPRYPTSTDSLFLNKYDPAGNVIWSTIFRFGTEPRYNIVDLDLSPSGSLFVTSQTNYSSYVTTKFTPAGSEEWRSTFEAPLTPSYFKSYPPPAVAVNDMGVYIAGLTGENPESNILLLKYTQSGIQAWVDSVESARSWDQVYAIATDDSDNVYITGSSEVNIAGGTGEYEFFGADLLTIKYSPAGATQWIAHYRNPNGTWIMPSAMKIDEAGNVYILATGDSTVVYTQFMTMKYNRAGELQWAATYQSQLNLRYVGAVDIDVSRQGDVFITGVHEFSRPSTAYLTIKYNQFGVQQWVASHSTPNGKGPTAIAVDDSNNVIVAGATDVVKYDQNGNEQWVYPGPATALVVDPSESIFLTDEAGPTTMLRETGSVVWSNSFGGNAIVLDPSGGVFVRNYAGGIGKINSSGVKVWGFETGGSFGSDLAVDTDGNVYTAGLHFGSGFSEYQTRSYSPSGVKRWTKSFDGNGATLWYQYPLALSKDGQSVYLGAIGTNGASNVFKTIKYRQVATSVSATEGEIPEYFSLGQNFPNPFNPMTNIEFHIPNADFISLKVYNLLGQEVATLVEEEKAPGRYIVEWSPENLASGLYFYTLRANTISQTRKLMLIK